jgi:large subunit ribosomal protein L21
LIRDADAFIGVYPFPEDTDVTVERPKSESRYSDWSWTLRSAPPNRQWCLSTVESGNCDRAAREILSRRDARKMKVMPIKLRQGDLTIPVEFGEMQYLRMWEYRDRDPRSIPLFNPSMSDERYRLASAAVDSSPGAPILRRSRTGCPRALCLRVPLAVASGARQTISAGIMFAVIRTGGKQYKVAKDDVISVEKLGAEPGATIELAEVLMIGEGAEVATGAPLLDGASVSATVVEQRRADKIIVFKKKRRHNYRRKKGHRQQQTVLRITEIRGANGSQREEGAPDGA